LPEEEDKNQVNEIPLYPGNPESLVAPSTLSAVELLRLAECLEPYLPIFTMRPGLCTLYRHTIDTGDCKPIKCRLRPISAGKRKLFDLTFDELMEMDIIEPSTSPWASTAFIVPKPTGGYRFVINYKPLNEHTIPDVYPVNRIDDMLAFLGTSNFFSVFDLYKGFHQIEVAKKDRPKTAFLSHRGLWQFKRMPMGLMNSPATFQRLLDEVLGDLKWKICICYFDDIIIFSQSFEEHCLHLQMVLQRLKDAGLTISPKKVQLFKQRIKFLGHIVEPGRVFPDPEKVIAIKNYPPLRTQEEVRRFLGLVSFYRRFIPNASLHAKPLTDLMKDEVKFEWGESQKAAFDFLRNVLTELSELHLPDLNGQFIISTDASKVGLGAVLSQVKDGVRFPIWYASRCLKPAETRYPIPELECLAVIWAIEKFRGFIEYTKFIVETDHQALSWLQRIKEPSGRLAHWFLILQHYDFEVHYKPGNNICMRAPDALSRVEETLLLDQRADLSRKYLIQQQDSDPYLGPLKEFLRGNSVSSDLATVEKLKRDSERSHLLEDGALIRFVGAKNKPWEEEDSYWRLWIPDSMKEKVLLIFHKDLLAGHLGIRRTFHRLEQRVYWFGMHKDVTKYVKCCVQCQESKNYRIPTAPGSSFLPESPWETISVDLMGPYPKGANQNRYLLVIVDIFSKYVEVFPLRAATSEKVVEKLWEVICRWGLPKVIISDNGSQFISRYYLQWCDMNGIQNFHIAVYHAQANITERYNETIKSMIVTTIERCSDWDRHIPELAFALRTSVSDSTKFTPAYLNTGRELRAPFDNLVNISLSTVRPLKDMAKRMAMINNIARDNMLRTIESHLRYYNRGSKLRVFEIGDLVWYRTHYLSDASKGFNSKLAPKRELCRVTAKVSHTVYDLAREEDGQIINKVHVNDLMAFIPDHSLPTRALTN
jgi:transposase InsO family protein